MKHIILSLLVISLLTIFSGCGAISSLMGGSGVPLTLTEVNPDFKKFEKNTALDAVTGNYSYAHIDHIKYDVVFKNAAILAAKASMLKTSTSMILDAPEKFKSAVAKGGKNLKSLLSVDVSELNANYAKKKANEFKAFKNYGGMDLEEEFAVRSVMFAITEAPGMIKQAEGIQGVITLMNPQTDFTGSDITKVGAAAAGIAGATSNISTVISTVPGVLTSLGDVIGLIK